MGNYFYNLDTKTYQEEEYLYELLDDYSTDGYYLMELKFNRIIYPYVSWVINPLIGPLNMPR